MVLHGRMDGSLAVYYQGQCLATKPAPLEAPVLRARNMARVISNMTDSDKRAVPVTVAKKPPQLKTHRNIESGPDHPWRRLFKVHIDRGVTNSLNN